MIAYVYKDTNAPTKSRPWALATYTSNDSVCLSVDYYKTRKWAQMAANVINSGVNNRQHEPKIDTSNPAIIHALDSGLYAAKNMVGQHIYVRRGHLGFADAETNDDLWLELHTARPQEQNEIALACSMFGWNIPAASRL